MPYMPYMPDMHCIIVIRSNPFLSPTEFCDNEVRMLTDKQSSVEWNVSRLERGLAIMHDATWPRLTKGWVTGKGLTP